VPVIEKKGGGWHFFDEWRAGTPRGGKVNRKYTERERSELREKKISLGEKEPGPKENLLGGLPRAQEKGGRKKPQVERGG